MTSQEIYNEIKNIPEIVSYITKDPFKYEIVPFDDRWGMPRDSCVIAARSVNPEFMKYDHDTLEVVIKRSEHINSFKMTIPFPQFFIFKHESLDEKMPLFYTGTYLITCEQHEDSLTMYYAPKGKEAEVMFNFDLYNYFETIINEEPRKRIIKFLDYLISTKKTPEYIEYLVPKIVELKDEYGLPLSFKEYAWKI